MPRPEAMPRTPPTDSFLTLARYRRLILLGRIRLPLEEARRIVGPDCAYHLYFRHANERSAAGGARRKARATRRSRRRRR